MFARILGSGTLEALVAGVDRWRKGNMEKCRQGLNACAFDRIDMGGSSQVSIKGQAEQEIYESRPFWVPDDNDWYTGYIFTVYAELKVSNAANTLTVTVKDDLGTVIWSDDWNSTSWSTALRFEFEPDPERRYIAYVENSDDTYDAWGFVYVIRSARSLP